MLSTLPSFDYSIGEMDCDTYEDMQIILRKVKPFFYFPNPNSFPLNHIVEMEDIPF
jgi:hypothetical protein